MSYEWFHEFFRAGKEIAGAVEDWRESMSDEEVEAFDGDLVLEQQLYDGMLKILKGCIVALVKKHYGDEYVIKRILEESLEGKIPAANLAFSVFSLVKIAQIKDKVKQVVQDLSFEEFHKAVRTQGQDTLPGELPRAKARGALVEVLADLERIQTFARGETPEGYALIEDFKAYARRNKHRGVLTFDQAAQQKGFAGGGVEYNEFVARVDLEDAATRKAYFTWRHKDGTKAGLLKLTRGE